jgi:hypothetical protein
VLVVDFNACQARSPVSTTTSTPLSVFCFTVLATARARAMPVFRRLDLAVVLPAVLLVREDLRLARVPVAALPVAFRVATFRVAAFRVAAFRFGPRFADFRFVGIVSSGLMGVGIAPARRDSAGSP